MPAFQYLLEVIGNIHDNPELLKEVVIIQRSTGTTSQPPVIQRREATPGFYAFFES